MKNDRLEVIQCSVWYLMTESLSGKYQHEKQDNSISIRRVLKEISHGTDSTKHLIFLCCTIYNALYLLAYGGQPLGLAKAEK